MSAACSASGITTLCAALSNTRRDIGTLRRQVTLKKLPECLSDAFAIAFSRCASTVVAMQTGPRSLFISIESKLHLPPRVNPIILTVKADASPVGVRQHKLPP
jgi:hypothetical protein